MLYSKAFQSSLKNAIKQGGRRHYGLPSSAIHLGTDPRKDKTVQLTPLRGVNIIHDPLLSKGRLDLNKNNDNPNFFLFIQVLHLVFQKEKDCLFVV